LTLTKLTVGKTYQCRVRAINAVGDGPYSEFVPAVAPTAPDVPQGVSAKWVTTSSVQVSFAAPLSDGGSAVTGYVVECTSTDGGVPRTASGASSPLTLTKLTVGKTYECRVRAINAFGDGVWSTFVLAVPLT
jgi:predicted RNA-binding protein with TRAM domain